MKIFGIVSLCALIVLYLLLKNKKTKVAAKSKFDEPIAAAVMWWARYLHEFSVQGISEESDGYFLLLYLRLIEHENKEQTNEDVLRFMKHLTAHLQRRSKKGGTEILTTDYSAQPPLSDICRQAGVSGGRFPTKAVMWIDFDKNKVTWRIVHGPEGQLYPVVKDAEKIKA